jgi:hypothetical protein
MTLLAVTFLPENSEQIPDEKYTFARKINLQPDHDIIPGSIEEDLTKGSENYFTWNPEVIAKSTSIIRIIRPTLRPKWHAHPLVYCRNHLAI